MSDPLPITVYSDVICPWCYVGKRRLEAALASPGMPSKIAFTWRPFELNPDMPPEGVERKVYRAGKFGEARSAQLDVQMASTGRELGIAFAFDRMQRTPNTRLAHRLIWEADRQGRQDGVVERLFHGYFEEGLDIGRTEVLESIAAEAGWKRGGVRRADGLREPGAGDQPRAARLQPGDPGRAVLHPAGQVRHLRRPTPGVLARGPAEDRERGRRGAGCGLILARHVDRALTSGADSSLSPLFVMSKTCLRHDGGCGRLLRRRRMSPPLTPTLAMMTRRRRHAVNAATRFDVGGDRARARHYANSQQRSAGGAEDRADRRACRLRFRHHG